jgi:hypothetical protein
MIIINKKREFNSSFSISLSINCHFFEAQGATNLVSLSLQLTRHPFRSFRLPKYLRMLASRLKLMAAAQRWSNREPRILSQISARFRCVYPD